MEIRKGKINFIYYILCLCSAFFLTACEENTDLTVPEKEEPLQQEAEMTREEKDALIAKEVQDAFPGIICWGDSLTFGYGADETSYPQTLEHLIRENIYENIPVINMGACGEDSITIAGRSGGIPYVISQNFTIPQDNSAVQICFTSETGAEVFPSIYTDVGINDCSIAGVEGTITVTKAGDTIDAYYFTRKSAGNAVNVTAGEKILTSAMQQYRDYISIVFVGTNGGFRDYQDLINQQNAIIASRTANTDKFLVVGITYGTDSDMTYYDTAMYQEYGDNYLNLRDYLSSYGVYEAGITPTENDYNSMLYGMVPAGLLSDNVHFNDAGYEVTGSIIYEKMLELGYFDPVMEIVHQFDEQTGEPASDNETNTAAFSFAQKLSSGINIGNALDSYGITGGAADITSYETQWGNPVITADLMKFIHEGGFNSVRLPITWEEHLDSDGNVDEAWLLHVKSIVDYAVNEGLYVIINVHHDKWFVPDYENLYSALYKTDKIWGQIAEYFQAYDEHLIFEGFNEPRLTGTQEEWGNGTQEAYYVINKMMRHFVDAVRESGGKNAERYLLVTPYCSNYTPEALKGLELPDDSHLLLSVHTYIPYEFALNENGTNEWNAGVREDTDSIDLMFKNLKQYSSENSIPIVLTEFGALYKNNEPARENWTEYFMSKARAAEISCIWWDNYYGGDGSSTFGIMNRYTNEWTFPDIVKILTKTSSYPFTEPADTPLTIYFCPKINRINTGNKVRMISALTRFHEFSKTPKKL